MAGAGCSGRWKGPKTADDLDPGKDIIWPRRQWGTEGSLSDFMIMSVLNHSSAFPFCMGNIFLCQRGVCLLTVESCFLLSFIGCEFKGREKGPVSDVTGLLVRYRGKEEQVAKPQSSIQLWNGDNLFPSSAVSFWVLIGQLASGTVKSLRFCEGGTELLLIWSPTFLVPFLAFRSEVWFPEGEMSL